MNARIATLGKTIRSRKFLTGLIAISLAAVPSIGSLNTQSASATSFEVKQPTDSDFPQHVDFVAVCTVVKRAADDPIVFPGQPGASHDHTFTGAKAVNASSTAMDLFNGGTTCTNSGDMSSYWMPTLLVDGQPRTPYQGRAYYRAATRDTTKLKPYPFGLKMLAGNPKATSAQSAGIAGFQCRVEQEGATVPKQSLPPQCASTDIFEMSVIFPNCWDGKNLDSADHRSHMSYAQDYKCDTAHPVQLPQLTYATRFTPGTTKGKITLSSMNSPLTLHADFFNAWDPRSMTALMKYCIYAHVFCETISDTRMPPGMTDTTPSGTLNFGIYSATTSTTSTTVRPTTTTSTTVPPTTTTTTSTTVQPTTTTTAASGPAITVTQETATSIRVHGVGFPAGMPSKVTLTNNGNSVSEITDIDSTGRFTVYIAIPSSWTGLLITRATADAGAVSASREKNIS